MRSKDNPSYKALQDTLKRASLFIESEINQVEPHTHSYYRLWALYTNLNYCIDDMKLIHDEVLGRGEAYRYDERIDMRNRILKQLGYE